MNKDLVKRVNQMAIEANNASSSHAIYKPDLYVLLTEVIAALQAQPTRDQVLEEAAAVIGEIRSGYLSHSVDAFANEVDARIRALKSTPTPDGLCEKRRMTPEEQRAQYRQDVDDELSIEVGFYRGIAPAQALPKQTICGPLVTWLNVKPWIQERELGDFVSIAMLYDLCQVLDAQNARSK